MPGEVNVGEELAAVISYVRGLERLRSAMLGLQPVVVALTEVAELDPDAEPELLAALEHLSGATDALERAMKFLDAKQSARTERL